MLRQRQSRLISTFDEVVYYSVARHAQILSEIGEEIRLSLISYGISSEQLPQVQATMNPTYRCSHSSSRIKMT